MLRLISALSLATILAIAGCGKSDDGAAAGEAPAASKAGADEAAAKPGKATPREVAQALTEAFTARDGDAAMALLPSAEALGAAFDCPGGELVKDLESRRGKARAELGGAPEGFEMALVDFTAEPKDKQELKVGDAYEGCKARAPVTIARHRLRLKVTEEGKSTEDGETWPFVTFGDGRWYFFKL